MRQIRKTDNSSGSDQHPPITKEVGYAGLYDVACQPEVVDHRAGQHTPARPDDLDTCRQQLFIL